MTILILGAGGLLGGAFVEAYHNHDVVVAGRRDFAMCEPGDVVRRAHASLVINCAADTDVEGAQRDPTTSVAANVVLPGLVAEACAALGAVLVHVSSTGCYGSGKPQPYSEDDMPQPTTVHHRHKLDGENRVRASGCDALILRTGWLFGGRPGQPKNFVWNRMIEARSTSRMVSDPFQVGNPTFVGDVARQAALLVERGVRGTVNCVSAPAARRLDYVRAIVAASRLPCEVVAAEAPFKRLARVSTNEAAESRRLHDLGLNIMPTWSEALQHYVAGLIDTDAWREASPTNEAKA